MIHSTLRVLINGIWRLECFDIEKLAKYMRCLVQVTLSSKTELSVNVVEDVCRYVKEAASVCHQQQLVVGILLLTSHQTKTPFPPLELEWMAATCFNHGLDLYGSNEDETSQKWLDFALSLAHFMQDGGVLERHLQERRTSLKWG